MKTDGELIFLMNESIEGLRKIFRDSGDLKVPETDKIIEMVYSYFLHNSILSLPGNLRKEYINHRVQQHDEIISNIIHESEFEHCRDEAPIKETMH